MPKNQAEQNKRIAKNTLFLYFRMILIMAVTLYLSRVVLDELGIVDYGVYNVVGGIVTMLTVLNSCMTTSTQRFITYELGRGDRHRLKNIFAASLNIHIAIALFVLLLAETLGLWFVNEKLVIPEERITAANWVYQLSVLTFCVNIIQTPYNATIIAHEQMNIFASISIFEACLKLGMAYLLGIIHTDKLVAYGLMVLSIQILTRISYQLYCQRHYAESRFRMFWDKKLYREMVGFAGWNLFGSVAWMLRGQGSDILLNLFFGPAVNAARGIAMQVSSAVMTFVSNFQVALNPQITKLYATDNRLQMERLCYHGIKFSVILLFTLTFPICLHINPILSLWLKDVPDYTSVFVLLMLLDAILGTIFGGPLMASVSATGNIRNYQLVVNSLILLVMPVSYVFLKIGTDVTTVFYVTIFFTVISGLGRFYFCKIQIGYSFRTLVHNVLVPLTGMFFTAMPLPILLNFYIWPDSGFSSIILTTFITIALSIISSWFIAMNRAERNYIKATIREYLRKKFK